MPHAFESIEKEFWSISNKEKQNKNHSIQLIHFGSIEQKKEYQELLLQADVVLSTAKHEFFGVSVMEGVAAGCYPVCPNRLSYPELYPKECLYNTNNQMFQMLKKFSLRPEKFREFILPRILKKINAVECYSMEALGSKYEKLLFGGGYSERKECFDLYMVSLVILNIILDQVSKFWIRNNVSPGSYSREGDYFIITNVEKSGAFLGLGSEFPPTIFYMHYLALPVIVLISVLVYVFKDKSLDKLSLVGFSLIIGGGIGNTFDSFLYGSVTDFLIIDFGGVLKQVYLI